MAHGNATKKVFSVHTPSILFGALVGCWFTLAPKARGVKIYDSKLRVQSKGALFPVNCPHSFMELITTAVFVHCMVCCITTHWVEKEDSVLSLSHSLSLSLLNCITYGNRAKLVAMLIGLEKRWKK
jgi:hypothetical protein